METLGVKPGLVEFLMKAFRSQENTFCLGFTVVVRQSLRPVSTLLERPPDVSREARLGVSTSVFCIALGGMIVLCFAPALFGFKTFVYRDFGLFGYPLAYHWRESFWHGEIPLWNPYSNCGLPFLAQWNTIVLYPLSLIYVLLPLPWALNVFCLLHLFIAGAGMYWLARQWTGSELGAAVAGAAFAFNGLMLSALMWPNNIAALAWMPWVVLTARNGWREGGRALALACLVGALQMLAGAPEVILFTWLFVGAFWLLDMWRSSDRVRTLSRGALLILLVAGICAAQLLPFLQLLGESQRAGGVSSTRWAMPIWGWANLLVPLFRMNEAASGVYVQVTQSWTSSYYIGIGTLLLAIAALVRVRDAHVRALGIFTVVSFILALGDSGLVYPFARKVLPFLNFMRFPIKFVICTIFALPLLAAFGVAWCESKARPAKTVLSTTAAILLGAIAVIVAIAYVWPQPDQVASDALWSGIARAVFLVTIAGTVWFCAAAQASSKRIAAGCVAVILVLLDGYTHAPPQNPMVDPSVFSPDLLKAEPITPQPQHGESRAMLSLAMLDAFGTNRLSSQADNFLLMRLWQYENLNLLERIPKIDGFYSLYLPHERDLHFRLYGSDGLPRPSLGDFLGVSQVVTHRGGKAFGWSFRDSSLPMTTLAANPVFLDAGTTLTNLMLSTFDPRKIVFLPAEARGVIHATNGMTGRIVSRAISPHRIRVDVETPEPNFLVIAQADYSAWSAYVDDRRVPIYRANYAFQAVETPAGLHVVELRYEDKAFRIGAVVSLLSIVGGLGLWRRSSKAATNASSLGSLSPG